jgi:type VI secretion system protein VasD
MPLIPMKNLRFLSLLCLVALLSGCSSITSVTATLHANKQVNPDLNGRPSPIAVRVYELKSLSVFNSADFFNLFEQDVALLGDEMLMRDELHFQPGETKEINRDLQPDTRYIGVIGAYRDIEDATWRRSIEVEPEEENDLSIYFGELGITILRNQK